MVEVVEIELVDEVVGSVLVVVGMVLAAVEVVEAGLVDEVVVSVLVAVEVVETALVVVPPTTGTVYVCSLEKPLSLL